uniref:Ribosomal RNA-processing protein 43 n=1 Tax=Timema shepardi TaxID=629360 RepID=A0A7R9AQN1_TIMSH|nr:unnamed protein product [Timema shepardi]
MKSYLNEKVVALVYKTLMVLTRQPISAESRDIRPDGRGLLKFRPIAINIGSISTADGSAIVKIGNTAVVCGIKLLANALVVLSSAAEDGEIEVRISELVAPTPTEPDIGYLVPNVELPPLCSPKFRPGPPSDQAQVSGHFVAELIASSGCIDLHQLCIAPEKMCWVLYCDIMCINHDGALLDACIAALIAALRTVTLPHVDFDAETEKMVVHEDRRKHLEILSFPAATTYAMFEDDILISDPTAEEENLCSGVLTIVVQGSQLCSVHKPGGSPLSETQLQDCIALAHRRGNSINKMVASAISSPER